MSKRWKEDKKTLSTIGLTPKEKNADISNYDSVLLLDIAYYSTQALLVAIILALSTKLV
jgi:hypothetical protein